MPLQGKPTFHQSLASKNANGKVVPGTKQLLSGIFCINLQSLSVRNVLNLIFQCAPGTGNLRKLTTLLIMRFLHESITVKTNQCDIMHLCSSICMFAQEKTATFPYCVIVLSKKVFPFSFFQSSILCSPLQTTFYSILAKEQPPSQLRKSLIQPLGKVFRENFLQFL